ncbi:ras-related protein Rab-6A isoform X1 [Lutzomyia longipalpis]|uniref:ras-related protein Rab-6A isoform X1 n=1 Tax=Lutzomyia longipalpis TaxID=7200 RepID=UPI0024843BBE|nr:ras-related protein Rab-6A isoform X1 [Lutzomyia longipalpis]
MRKLRRFLSGDELEKRIIRYFQRPHRLNITPYVQEDFSSHCRDLATNHVDVLLKRKDDSTLMMRKIIFVGESAVGKTSLITKFYYGEFDSTYMSTLGIDYQVERFVVLNCEHRLQLWDTAGQERFRAMALPFYRGASTIVSVFDMSNPSTIASAVDYISIARLHSEMARKTPCPTFLIGNKLDLLSPNDYRNISEQGQKIAQEINAEYYEVSCKDASSVTRLFRRIALINFEDYCAGIEIPIELNPFEKFFTRVFRLKQDSERKRPRCSLS